MFEGKVYDRSGRRQFILAGSSAGSLDMGTSFAGFGTICFATGSSWTLEGGVSALAAGQSITEVTTSDTIVLDGFAGTSGSFAAGEGLVLSDGAATETLGIAGSFTTADFTVQTVGSAMLVDQAVPCFCAGTRLATPHGNVPVQALKIGDLVRAATRGYQPIRWIGRRSYDGRFIAGNRLALPVKIRRHALGFNVPSRDLFVSPGHAICEGGVLVHAWRFINGVSITQAGCVEQVEYFHIELENHALLFAENTPVESFLDNGCRALFQNAASAPETAAQAPCLPVVEDGYIWPGSRRA